MSKYEVSYPNTVKYQPQIKNVSFEIFDKTYRVNNGVRNLMRVNKMIPKIQDDPEIIFEVVDMMFYKGFCDEIEAIEPAFPFDDLIFTVMKEIENNAPDALHAEEIELTGKDEEPKKD